MSEHKYWRHRWSPQHVTTVDMTGTMNAPQWEPVRVLNDAELAALVTPTREQIAKAMCEADPTPERTWELAPEAVREAGYVLADAVLALMAPSSEETICSECQPVPLRGT